MERKVCFISDVGNWQGGLWTCVQRLTPSPPQQAVGESIYRLSQQGAGGNIKKQHHHLLTVIFKLIISSLTSIILVVLGTVNLQFQGVLVPISL